METTQVNEKNFADTIKQGTVLLDSRRSIESKAHADAPAAAAPGGV